MDESTLLLNIKEMIIDEQKLVTYTSLSKDLCLHVNDGKRLLSNAIEDIKKNKPETQLNICFIISGLLEDNKARTIVSSEKDLDELRKEFRSVFYEHVYSVAMGLPEADPVAFLAINKFQDFPLYTGLIKSVSCEKRTLDEISNLMSHSQEKLVVEQKPNSLPKKVKEEVLKNTTDHNSVAKVQETKSEPIIKPSPKKESVNNTQKPDNKKNGNKAQKGIAGFFSKSNSAPTKNVVKNAMESKVLNNIHSVEIKKEPKVNEVKIMEVVKVEKMEIDEVKTEYKQQEEKTAVHSENSKSKNKTVNIKKNAKVDKKRKRVLQVSDSESEDDKDPFAEEPVKEESDDEIPPTPTVNTVKITSGIVNPKKKRKVVDKTYTDEEGYILTKKEVVYESCSDNEEDVTKENIKNGSEVSKENVKIQQSNHTKVETSPSKNKAKNGKKKISPPKKGQATLMNFFKKV